MAKRNMGVLQKRKPDFSGLDVYQNNQVKKSNSIKLINDNQAIIKINNISYNVSKNENICNSGYGNIVRSQIFTKDIKIKLSGYGSIFLSGVSYSQQTILSGYGTIDARRLGCLYSTIKLSGYGDAYIVAIDELNAKISGYGNVYCFGRPKVVNVKTSGCGNVFFYDLEGSVAKQVKY